MISLKELKAKLIEIIPAPPKLLGPAPDDMTSIEAYNWVAAGNRPVASCHSKFDPPIWTQSEAARASAAAKRVMDQIKRTPLDHPKFTCGVCGDDLRKGSIRSKDVYYCFPCWDEHTKQIEKKSFPRPDGHLGGVEL